MIAGLLKNSLSDVLWISLGRAGVQFSSLFVFFISAKVLPVEEYGLFALITSFLVFSELLSRESVENYLATNSPLDGVCSFFFVVSVFLGMLTVALVKYLVEEMSLFKLLIFFLIPVFHFMGAFVRGCFLNGKKMKELSVLSIISALLSAFLAVYLLKCGYGFISLIVQQLFLWVCIALNGLMILKFNGFGLGQCFKFGVGDHNVKRYFRDGFLSSVLTVLSNRLDVFLLTTFFGLHIVGLYSFVKRVYQILQDLVIGGIERIVVSKTASYKGDRLSLINISLVVVFCVTFTASVFCIYFVPVFFDHFFPAKWTEAYPFFAYMSGGLIFSCLLSISRAFFLFEKTLTQVLKSKIFELVLTFVLMVSAMTYGVDAMVLSYSVKFLIVFLFTYYVLYQRIIKK